MTAWLVTLAKESDRMRADASTKPPGGLGTTSVIGLLGKPCAKAAPQTQAASKNAAGPAMARRLAAAFQDVVNDCMACSG